MNDINRTIIDAIIRKADALCPDSLALIGVYGSVATGDEHEKSDLDLMIVINDKNGYALADGFILDDIDVGYDIYCTSWDMLEEDARCSHAHLSKLFDSDIVYYKDKSALKRLDEIRRKAAKLLASDERYDKSENAYCEAEKMFAKACLTDSLSKVRSCAGAAISFLEDAVMLYNGQYFRKGTKRAFDELGKLNIPFDFKNRINYIIQAETVEKIRTGLTELLVLTREYLQVPKKKEVPSAENISGTYEEMYSNWKNKMTEAADRGDVYSSFMNLAALQYMLHEIAEDIAVDDFEIMDKFNPNNLDENVHIFDRALSDYLTEYEKAGISPKHFSNVEEFAGTINGRAFQHKRGGSEKKKVIAAGHICLDITPIFTSGKVDNLSDLLIPGKLVQLDDVDVHTGGSVANTGLAMKLFGADVSLMGKIGKDAFGEIVLNILNKYDAQDGMIVSDEESTAYTVVLAIPGIDRIFLHNPGANDTFCSSDIPDEALEQTAVFHFGYPTIMTAIYKENGAQLVEIMRRAKAAGAATSLDMAAVDADSEAGKEDWDSILKKVLPYVDFFVPSVEELCYMLDRERYYEWQKRAAGRDVTEVLTVDRDIKPLADRCMEYGARILLLKCGAPGLYYRSASKEVLQGIGRNAELNIDLLADKEGFETSFVPDAVLSGTGAGDTSIAAFLTAVLDGYSLEEGVRLAAATGASCVAAYDALSGLKSFEELKQKIAAGWRKRSSSLSGQ